MPIQVIFTYDETSHKWEVQVMGTNGETETRDAFAAVVATCQEIDYRLQDQAPLQAIEGGYKLTPAVL